MSALDDKGQPLLDSATVGSAQNGVQFTVTVAAADEIGVSQTYFQAVSGTGGNLTLNRTGSRINGSGSTSVSTDYEVGQGGGNQQGLKAGDTITLTAMAVDLSGNIGVALAVNVIVGP